ncbi:hypothetical protein K439DRAFT_821378 [Ramaria rubella]|nr:hypothetical protein K439DRAFT_821378 [Ramaria rubella]
MSADFAAPSSVSRNGSRRFPPRQISTFVRSYGINFQTRSIHTWTLPDAWIVQSRSNLVEIPLHGVYFMGAHHANIRYNFTHVLLLMVNHRAYQPAGEAELNAAVMGALDGNNSLKRFVRVDRNTDSLEFESDYYLSNEYVNQFKDEVKRKVRSSDKMEQVDIEGDPTDGNLDHATCTVKII